MKGELSNTTNGNVDVSDAGNDVNENRFDRNIDNDMSDNPDVWSEPESDRGDDYETIDDSVDDDPDNWSDPESDDLHDGEKESEDTDKAEDADNPDDWNEPESDVHDFQDDDTDKVDNTKNQEPENGDEQNDVDDKDSTDGLYSTYKERIDRTPKDDGERGEWEGERGESKYVPNDKETQEELAKYNIDGIEYKDGIPDFSPCAEASVEIDNMTENRQSYIDDEGNRTEGNFEQADNKCAEQWNKEGKDGKTDWTGDDVAKWRKEHGYTWHECNDGKTCQLVPTKIHSSCGHLGGVAECKRRDADDNNGGGFDE